jgi:hypothetical protein
MTFLNFVYTSEVPQNLEFQDNEVVRFYVDSASVTDHGFCLNAKVLSGRHEDRIHVLYFSSHIKSGEYNPATREFCSKFFSPEEMKNGMSIDSLVGRTFEAKCKVKVSNGKRFQNFGGFRVQTPESW